MNATATDFATEKQLGFLTRLLDEADALLDERQALTGADWPQARGAVDALRHNGDFTKREASAAIDRAMDNNKQLRSELKGLGVDTAAAPAQTAYVSEPGMYRIDGRIFKVLPSRNSDRHYAKELTGESETGYSFTYAPGAMRMLRAEHRMTEDKAREFGRVTGYCCNCAKLLTDPKSVEDGIGPVCKKALGWK